MPIGKIASEICTTNYPQEKEKKIDDYTNAPKHPVVIPKNQEPGRLINAFDTLQNPHGSSSLLFEMADEPFAFLLQLFLSILCVRLNPLLYRHLLLWAGQVAACLTMQTTVLLVAASREKNALNINWSPRSRRL